MTIPKHDRNVGDYGQCEAHDMVPTGDDAIDVRCPIMGRAILEDVGHGHKRLRFVCAGHGLASAYEVN